MQLNEVFKIISTVVGSYPVIKKNKTTKDKILAGIGLYDSYRDSIKIAVEDQTRAGIDIISDGQVRENMINIFSKFIPGMSVEEGSTTIQSKIMPSVNPITVNDFKYAQKIMEETLKTMDLPKEILDKKGVKGIITGPSTMVFSSRLKSYYKNKNYAIIDMAYALKSEAIALEKAGAKYIQLDEPFISTGMVDIKTASEAISIISEDIKIPVAMHVCGDLSEVFEELLDFNVDILDLEFAGDKKNLELLEKHLDKLNGKKIGLGCIDTKLNEVDDFDFVSNIIEKGISLVGKDNLLIDPDCGMKRLDRDIAFSKLELLVKAMENNS